MRSVGDLLRAAYQRAFPYSAADAGVPGLSRPLTDTVQARPIETAPRNGCVVQVIGEGEKPVLAFYARHQWMFSTSGGELMIVPFKPTHWRPRPEIGHG